MANPIEIRSRNKRVKRPGSRQGITYTSSRSNELRK